MIYALKEYIGPVLEKLALIADAKRPHLNAHADASSKAKGLNLGPSLDLHLCFAYASNEGSGVSTHKRRLARASVVRQCEKYRAY